MSTYLILNVIFMAVVIAGVFLLGTNISIRRVGIVIIVMLVLTAIFDSLIVGARIVAYSPEKILGIYIGKAPIEDFAYAVVASFFVPFIWEKLGRHAK